MTNTTMTPAEQLQPGDRVVTDAVAKGTYTVAHIECRDEDVHVTFIGGGHSTLPKGWHVPKKLDR